MDPPVKPGGDTKPWHSQGVTSDENMNNNHRSKLSYYKQIYNFGYLAAQFAHPSWLEGIQVPAKIAQDAKNVTAFQSQLLLQKVQDLDRNSRTEHSILLFIASLPKSKFNRFLNYLVLAFLKNDKSLLINGVKLKKLAHFFSTDEMEFLTHEKEVKIKLNEKFSLEKNLEIDEFILLEIAFHILKGFFNKKNSCIFDRLKLRFPKDYTENKSAYFNFYIDSSVNISVISIIAQALFPEIYSIFESEDLVK